MAMADNNSDDRYDPAYDSMTNTYDKVHEFADAMASKAGNTVGFIGLILTLSATLWWDIYKSNELKNGLETVNLGFAWILGILFLAMFFALATFFTTEYAIAPGPDYIFRICFEDEEPKDKIMRKLCDKMRKATNENREILDLKSRTIRCSMVLLGIGILSFIYIVLYIILIL
jgi:hypothetical protein